MNKLTIFKFVISGVLVAICASYATYWVATKKLVTATWDEYLLCGKNYIAIETETLSEAVKIRRVFQQLGSHADRHFHALLLREPTHYLSQVSNSDVILVEPIYSPLNTLIARSPDRKGTWVAAILLSEDYRNTEDPITDLAENLQQISWQGLEMKAYGRLLIHWFNEAMLYRSRMEVRTYDRKKFKDLYGVSCKKLEML